MKLSVVLVALFAVVGLVGASTSRAAAVQQAVTILDAKEATLASMAQVAIASYNSRCSATCSCSYYDCQANGATDFDLCSMAHGNTSGRCLTPGRSLSFFLPL